MLDAPIFNIGRAHEAGIKAAGWLLLDDGTVSRLQALLRWNDETGSYFLSNRSETNPTRVNELMVEGEQELKVGDRIRIGRCVLQLQKVIQMPTFHLNVVGGPDCGQSHVLNTLNVALGGPIDNSVVETGPGLFDQEVVLSDPAIPARCLTLSWNARSNGFDLWRPQGGHLEVTLERVAGRLTWQARLPLEHEGVVLADDVITVGQTRLQICQERVEVKKADTVVFEAADVTRFVGPKGAVGVRRPRKAGKTVEVREGDETP